MPAEIRDTKSTVVNEHSLKDDIVISGISGRLPKSNNIEEFKKNLFEGVNCLSDESNRWPLGFNGIPTKYGIIKDIASFDATFFDIDAELAHKMDPQLRLLLEVTYEAIIDAGINPASLRGTRTGVFTGVSISETQHLSAANPETIDGSTPVASHKVMLASRISYTFDFKGPSHTIDTACSSAFFALHQAVVAMRNGECDLAIVGGANIIQKVTSSILFNKLNMLSQDGGCKAFDAKCNGYSRADSVSAILLQKSSDAHRVYATVVKTKVNVDGYKVEGITYPSREMQYRLMREVYDETGINPADISYVEAHGTGTKVGDPEEANSIASIYCKDRESPLLIGSVKSNMGHSEAGSGMCAIAKVLIAMENGIIPPNLHYKTPNPNIPALLDGRIKVVDKPTPWDGGLVALNNFGFGGANAHVILRSNPKEKVLPLVKTKLPKLVALSGRTTEAVNYMLDGVRVHKQDNEFIALVRDIHADNIRGHTVRGFEIVDNPDSRQIDDFNGSKRPIWFVFSGMGSQWEGMGRQLLCIETFRRSLEDCAAVLKPVGIDLMDLILHGTSETYQNVVNSFITIAAIQVGLVDLLTLLGIHADGMIGHSIGELGCAYADNTLTMEQIILTAYWRGKSVTDSDSPPGAMAAVGLSWDEAIKRCPPGVYPVCHNSADSVTISGPIDATHDFLKELQGNGIFTKLVNSCGYAFHTKYIKSGGPKLRNDLEKVIPNPKKRSSRWISSSVAEKDWGSPLAQLSSAAYHLNNFYSPVLFHEAVAHIPDNAIAIEIAPHCLFQAILRKSLPPTVTNLALHKWDQKDNVSFLLSNIGKLYTAGAQPQISKLYPPVSYPVGRGTPMISSLVKWDHSTKWNVSNFSYLIRNAETLVSIELNNKENSFLTGHTIDGRLIYPATGYVYLVWKTFASLNNTKYEKFPVVFENVQFHRATIIPKNGPVTFMINTFTGSGHFELCEGESIVVTGRIRNSRNIEREQLHLPPLTSTMETEVIELTMKDIYKEFRLRGYDYSGAFQGIKKADNRGIIGELNWCNNWISFMDTIIQFPILEDSRRFLFVPTRIEYLSIDPIHHKKLASELPQEGGTFPIYNYKKINCIKSGGVEIRGIDVSVIERRQVQALPKLERYAFIPYENNQILSEDPDEATLDALNVLLQVVCENMLVATLKIAEVTGERPSEALLTSHLLNILRSQPIIKVDSQLITTTPDNYMDSFDQSIVKVVTSDISKTSVGQDLHVLLAADILTNKCLNILENLSTSLTNGGFIISEESGAYDKDLLKETDLTYVATQTNGERTYVLLTKTKEKRVPTIIYATENNFSWLEDIKVALKTAETKEILVVNEGEEICGIVGFMNCLRLESGAIATRYVFIQDQNAPKFSLTEPFYEQQINKQMMANVLKDGQWGCYRHLSLEKKYKTPSFQAECAFANILVRGDLSSLRWLQSPLHFSQSEKYPDREMCTVYYASLNFKDIMLATGKLPLNAMSCKVAYEECILGIEFSGRDSKGKRIMGIVDHQGIATTVLANPLVLWEVPDKWTLEEAGTIPVVYATSYYALLMYGQLQPGETILIHAGSGGVGQASITIALHMGCKVFTTVGSQEKRNFLKKKFPQLTDRNIGNTRDTSFEQLIMSETHGRGVDVVLNSLAEEKLEASLRCLTVGGRFLEIGKYDLAKNTHLQISDFDDISFYGIHLDLFTTMKSSRQRELVNLINDGIKNGVVQPLEMKTFPEDQIEKAFRHMTAGKHIGKVLIKIRDEEAQKVVAQPSPKTVMAIPRTYMNPDKSYVLIGGLGGFGLELANWMIRRGAKHVVLVSRSGIRTGYQSLCVRRWRESGVNIIISTADCTTLDGAEQLIKQSNEIASVGGIFNLAAVLNDALIENLNEDNFKTVALPKIDATKHLDAVSRKHCPSLDYFVVFSSVACGRGNIGQTNYGFANSAMERIIEKRKSNGLPGLAIQWGPVGDVGLVIETMGVKEIELGGTLPQRMNSCLSTMDTFLQQLHPIVSSIVLADRNKTGKDLGDVNLVDAVANIMGIKDPSKVNPNSTLGDLGLDSLMGAEIKQTFERSYDVVLSPQELRDLTFGRLLEISSGNTNTKKPEADKLKSNEAIANELIFQFENVEIIPTESFVKLETKSSEGIPLFLVHAIDGTISPFKAVANELKRPAWGFQCTPDTPLDSMGDIAQAYIKLMKEIQKKGPYHIAGYSFGASVAFEMGLQLEKNGEEVELTLMDGAPEIIRVYSLRSISVIADDEGSAFENAKSLSFLANKFAPEISVDQAYHILSSESSEEEALNKLINLMDNTRFKIVDLKIGASLIVKKVQAASVYEPVDKFNGKVTFIKAKESFPILNNDYGFTKICNQDVQIIEVEGNHRTILVGDSAKKIASILEA